MPRFLVFTIYLAIAIAMYCGTAQAKFVADFIDIYNETDFSGWLSFFHVVKGVHVDVVSRGLLFLGVKFFGLNPTAWMLATALLHAVNTWLVYLFIAKVLKLLRNREAELIARLSGLVFVLSPYHTEVVVWLGAFNYLVVALFVLLSLNTSLNYFVTGKVKWLVATIVTTLGAAFSHELAVIIPPAMAVVFLLSSRTFSVNRLMAAGSVTLLSVAAYFVSNKIFKHDWIGHYGASAHLSFQWQQALAVFNKYIAKICLLTPFMPEGWQGKIFAAISTPGALYATLIAYVVFALFSIWYRFTYGKLNAVSFFVALFGLAVAPVLNLYFPDFIKIHADRYCYLPSVFLVPAILVLFFAANRYVGFLLATVMVIANGYALHYNNASWQQAGKVEQQLEADFLWKDAKRVYILNLPENYNGAYMYRSLGYSKFKWRYDLMHTDTIKADVVEIVGYNMMSVNDSVKVMVVNDSTLQVELSDWGRWYWLETHGAYSYENELVKVDMDEWNHTYRLTFKALRKEDVVIYQSGTNWRRVALPYSYY